MCVFPVGTSRYLVWIYIRGFLFLEFIQIFAFTYVLYSEKDGVHTVWLYQFVFFPVQIWFHSMKEQVFEGILSRFGGAGMAEFHM